MSEDNSANSPFTAEKRFSHLAQRLANLSGLQDSENHWLVHEQALQMQRRGEDVILLSIGDPDFRTPEPIVDNAVSHIRVGRTHYSASQGELNLRRAIADQETRTSPHPCSPEEVAIFPGATNAIYAVLSCLLNPGDAIVIPTPAYVGYSPITAALQLDTHFVNTSAEQGFVPSFESLIRAVGKTTRAILINTPGNPSGAIIGRETLSKLANYCHRRGIWLICDEVYSMFTYEKRHISLRASAQQLDNIVMIDGLSKSHAMSGWRVGWAVAPRDLVKHLTRFSAMSIFGCPQFIQDAAAFALSNDEYYVAEMRTEYRRRRDQVCPLLGKIPGIGYLRPESGMFIMVDVNSIYGGDDQVFASELLATEKVSVIPGCAFGACTRGHIRLSLAQPMKTLLEGCKRIERFVAANLMGNK